MAMRISMYDLSFWSLCEMNLLTDIGQSQSIYGRQYQETYSTVQQQTFSFPKTAAYATVNQGQTNMRPSTSQRTFQAQTPSLNCVDDSPMLGNDYAQWSLGRGRGSFAEFSKTPNVSKEFRYQSSGDMKATSFASNSTVPTSVSSYTTMAPVPIGDSFSIDRTSPSTAYSSYSSTNTSVEPNNLMTLETLTMNPDLRKNDWWQNVPRNCVDQFHTDFDAMVVHDGLPRYQTPQSNPWNMGPSPCSSQLMSSYTVSPKDVLTLDVPLAMSTSGSSQGTVPDSSDSSTGYSSRDNTADYSGSERMSVAEQPNRRSRHLLPTEPEVAQRHVSASSSNDAQSKHSRKSPPKTKSFTKSTSELDDSYSPPSSKKHSVSALKLLSPKKIEPKPSKMTVKNSPKPAPAEEGMHHRSEKDNFLINSKLAGMSYKEIRRKGRFTEAESTLRGRFRTLTKHKTARVRKPEWDDNDVSARTFLCRCVKC